MAKVAAKVAAPKRRRSGPSGKHTQEQRIIRAPAEFWQLIDRVVEDDGGGLFQWWVRNVLQISAAISGHVRTHACTGHRSSKMDDYQLTCRRERREGRPTPLCVACALDEVRYGR